MKRKNTIGYRVYRADGTTKRFATRRQADVHAAQTGGRVSRIKRNHNRTQWHEACTPA